jgi:hypothetical protein
MSGKEAAAAIEKEKRRAEKKVTIGLAKARNNTKN